MSCRPWGALRLRQLFPIKPAFEGAQTCHAIVPSDLGRARLYMRESNLRRRKEVGP